MTSSLDTAAVKKSMSHLFSTRLEFAVVVAFKKHSQIITAALGITLESNQVRDVSTCGQQFGGNWIGST